MAELGPFVLATTNPNKAREIREIFAGLEIELLPRPGGVPDVEETELTLLGNARLKASSLVEATGMAAVQISRTVTTTATTPIPASTSRPTGPRAAAVKL